MTPPEPAQSKATTDPLALSSGVSDRVEIRDVRLAASAARQKPIAADAALEVRFSQEVETQVNRKDNLVIVIPKFTMEASTAEGETQEVAVLIEAEFLLLYKIKDCGGLTKDHFDSFGRINGVYNAWPYWREFVQNTIARMGLPAFTIPVYRIVTPKQSPKKKVASKARKTAGKKNSAQKKPAGSR